MEDGREKEPRITGVKKIGREVEEQGVRTKSEMEKKKNKVRS